MQRICAAPAPAGQAGTRVGDTFFFVFFFNIVKQGRKECKISGKIEEGPMWEKARDTVKPNLATI